MRIGNKIFPYPTLNQDKELSGYNDTSSFELTLQTTEEGDLIKDDEHVLLKNIHFKLNNIQLQALYDDKKLECALVVECSESVFRERFPIKNEGLDISIPLNKLNNTVHVSAFMYATEKIERYVNDDFDEDYLGYKFYLEKYDIVTIDDGYKFRIDVDCEDDNKVSSIFTLVRSDSKDDRIHYESGSEKINIYLSPDYYSEYTTLKRTATANNIVFSILLIPVLSSCLEELKVRFEDLDDIEEIIGQKRWFKSICMSYQSISGSKLTIDEFKEKDSLELAQMVINNATCKGLQDLREILFTGMQGGEDEDE